MLLLVSSCVYAEKNMTDDVIGETSIKDSIMVVSENVDDLEKTNNETNFVLNYDADIDDSFDDINSANKLKLENTSKISADNETILNSVHTLEKEHLEETYVFNYSDSLEFKIDLNGKENTDYDVYVSETGGGSRWDIGHAVTSDNDGDITFSIHLDPGHYRFSIFKSRNSEYYNSGWQGHGYYVYKVYEVKILPFYGSVNYANVKIKGVQAIFGQHKEICYEWDGLFKGYLKFYKGSKVIDSIYLDNWNYWDMSGYRDYYNTIFLPAGTFTAKIIDMDGKVITKSTIKILKTSTKVKISSITIKSGTTKYIEADVYDGTGNVCHEGGKVKFSINGKNYYAKVKSGTAKIKIKVPSKLKTYTCKATFLGDNNAKSSSKTFKITVKKATTKKTTTKKTTTKKKTTSFTVTVPVKLDQYTSKTVGKHTVKIHKFITDYGSYQHIKIALSLYKNNKKIKSSSTLYKTKVWFHLKNGDWKYWGVNNYGRLSFNELTYNQYMKVDKAKVMVWIKS